MRSLVIRLALGGALAGALCGVVDFALVAAKVGPFLPTGPLRLCGFLMGLYGVAGLLAGLVLGLVATLLQYGDVGEILHGDGGKGARLIAYLVLGAAGLVGIGFAARYLVENMLVVFHHRMLIAALAGVAVAGVTLGVLLCCAIFAPLFSSALPFGPQLRVELRGSKLAFVPMLIVGLYTGAAAVAGHVLYLEGRPRMNHPMRAFNAALAAPALVALGLALAWFGYRALARVSTARPSFARTYAASVLVLLVPPALVAAATWTTTRQVNLRPVVTGLAIVLGLGALSRPLLRTRAALVLLVLTPLLGAMLFGLGRVPRVRKASALVGLAPQLVRGIQLVSDLDHDGYSSVLGGGDCNDLDKRVHPGAFDWPDDGVDQDCNGHEATLTARPLRVYSQVPSAVPEMPNVLLLTIDALRADHVSSYGYERRTTPRLDELAKDGIRFENAWAHAPSTRYSVPAILTGRYPSTIAVNNDSRVHWPPQVLPENRMLAEIMKDLGYRTAATLSYHYFERGWGLDQGFDDYDIHLQNLHSLGGDPSATQGTSSHELADVDIAWLKAHQGERFFMWSHFYDTHFQFQAHPDLPESNFGGDEQALYDAEIRFTDHHIGRVFDTLKELGLWDKTIILITADHGDGFGEHGIPASRRHGYHLYRTETKVPVLIRVPGMPPRIVDTPIGHVDLLPTLLNLLRRAPTEEPQLLGESLVAAMLGDESKKDERTIYQEVWYEGPTSKKALASRGAHLIRNLVPEDTTELYDLTKDPAEEHDLSGLGDTIEATLRARLGEITDALAIPPGFAGRMKDAISRGPSTPQIELGDTLGDYVRVVGADVDLPRSRAGTTSTVTVHLEIKREIPDGWILFTHATAASGRSMNLDHAPLEGLVPLQTLSAGTFVKDPIRVAFPVGWPQGPVKLELGLYKKGARAPARGAHSAADAVTVATLQVGP